MIVSQTALSLVASGAEVLLVLCRWALLESLDKISPGIVNWKVANKPPIKMPFRKVENCNQVVKIGKQLKFSLVNIAGNDIVQGNKKLILGTFTSTFLKYSRCYSGKLPTYVNAIISSIVLNYFTAFLKTHQIIGIVICFIIIQKVNN